MASRPRSGCSRSLRRALPSLVLALVSGCRAASPPGLAQAFQGKGDAAARTKAFMRVAVQGREAERARAALLWGLFACDARAPQAALTGFALTHPRGGMAHLAARRLEEALDASRSRAVLWAAAARAPWLSSEDRVRLRLRGAEALSQRGEAPAAVALLPDGDGLRREDEARRLLVIARAGGAAASAAERRLTVEFPQLAAAIDACTLARLAATFTASEWAANAQAWLDAGQPESALRAAARAGGAGFVLASRAALRLHRPSVAVGWAARGGERCGACLVERADAERQLAWGTPRGSRRRPFERMLQSSERAAQLVPAGDPLRGRAEVLESEALVELGRFAQAAALLKSEAAAVQTRFEWVCRRLALLEAREAGGTPRTLARSGRGRRLAAFWQARALIRRGDRTGLEALAASGFPDLPAQWAAEALGRRGVAVVPSDAPPAVPSPPAWAADLLTTGRVADVVFAWRSELESAGGREPGWLGLVALAAMPALEAIPLLVRGEPRLQSGPWQGLPRDLLQRYLPLPWRAELDAAARRTGVPPWLLAGLVRQESAWNPNARSPAGAFGLAQVLPDVAAEALRGLPGVPRSGDLSDPGRNLTAGAALLASWRRDVDGSWTAALACYNAGASRVREVWEACGRHDGPEFVEALEIPETWDYVHRVVLLAEGYRILYWPEGRAYPWT